MTFTVIKKIGAGQTYTSLSSWDAGAPDNFTTSNKWSAGNFVGTFQQRETVTGAGITSGRFLDSDGSSYIAFGTTTTPSTGITVTGSTSLATCIISGSANVGCIWRGEINASTDVLDLGTTTLDINGHTTSSTCYEELTAASGASFVDNANAQTNALCYNESNGCAVKINGYHITALTQSIDSKISRLQIKNTSSAGRMVWQGPGSATADLNQCVMQLAGNSDQRMLLFRGANCTMRNSILESLGSGSSGYFIQVGGGGKAINMTFVNVNATPQASAIEKYNGTNTFENCAFFGASGMGDTTSTFTTCMIDNAISSAPTGCTKIIFSTTADATHSGFQNITSGSEDFRIKTGSALVDAGTTDSTWAATDIVGTTRPQGSAYDIGCWEYVSGGGGSVFMPATGGVVLPNEQVTM